MGVKYMGLSNDLLSQFAKITNDKTKNKKESNTYGTVKVVGDTTYVQLDGSDLLTPYSSTADVKDGDRVQVAIKNHNATITGNLSSPSARTDDVKEIDNKVTAHGNTITAMDNNITSINNNITEIGNTVNSQGNQITQINDVVKSQGNTINSLNNTVDAQGNTITSINNTVNSQGNTIETMNNDIKIYNSSFQITDGVVTGIKGIDTDWIKTEDLEADHAAINSLDSNYANIDFTNIGKAAIEQFYSTSGIIKDLVIGDTTVTGKLVGVTIVGDLIEGGTVKADKLVIQGTNGLYYKLNTDGETVTSEQTEYNSLNGSIITAKSVTAEKVNVTDLVAFGATIGGFKITDNSIYSGVKESTTNTTRGIYLDNTGQIAFGDANNFIKFYKDANEVYKLDISARQITFGASNTSVEDVATAASKAVVKSVDHYYLSDSPTSLVGGSWGNTAPSWTNGKYIWHRSLITYGDGSTEYTPSENGVCITGNTGPRGLQGLQGEKGEQGIPGAVGEPGPKGEKGDTGEAGQNGKTSYFHIKYSSVDKPTSSSQMTETPSTYIGTYVDFTEADSTNPSKYTWSRFEGAQGEQGIPGTNGINGKTSYLHIKYSNDGGSTFTANNGETPGDYIGQCTDFNASDPTTVSSYTWSKIKGEKGDQGIQGLQGEKGEQGIPGTNGTNGTNGKTSYFHIKYSSVDKPTSSSQMTETPSTYIGTYVDYTSTDSTDPKKYTWSRFQGAQGEKGDKGIPGTNGTNGKTSYLHIAYANSADGKTGFDISTSTNKLYIGQYTDFTAEDSTDPTKYSWTKIKGETGAAGADAISITITSSNGTIFKNNSGSTVLTAHVYKGGVEQSITDAGVCGKLGSIKWYKGTSTTAVATAKTLTVTASDVTNYMAITCQLEK